MINIIATLRKELPPTFSRSMFPKLSGGIFAVQTLANYDSLKIGPPFSRVGNRVIYERDSFLKWLETRLK